MVESLDIYRLAWFFGIEMSEVITQYTDTAFLAWGFPVFMLKTKPHRDTCVFLKSSGCSVYEARPRTCRIYPLGIGPDDDNPGTWLSFIVSKKQHHFKGRKHRAGDWVDENLTPEDRAFITADYAYTGELAKLMKSINRRNGDEIVKLMLIYKYSFFDTAEDFQPQYARNMERLKQRLKQLGGV